ncbi:hypothetical protein [Acidisphaera sp. L21]|uniref:hypothetical protein n=1 Tax=Acidisphaera sp. L21 TaxID=1641851 RepID=UPI001C2084C7|nr:hypothetical protein [Acidisphaera sp. L21]
MPMRQRAVLTAPSITNIGSPPSFTAPQSPPPGAPTYQPPSARPAASPQQPAAASFAPPPQQAAPITLQGDIVLDGARVGRWMTSSLARQASRPAAGPTGPDPRQTPLWSGQAQGF